MSSPIRISDAASLALHTMVMLADNPDSPMSAREVAATFKVSEAHLAKVLQRLAHAGLVNSARGPKGGFTLAKRSDRVTLLDVYETIEGPLSDATCLLSSRLCGAQTCILGDFIGRVNSDFRQYLSDTTLADVTPVYEALHASGAIHA